MRGTILGNVLLLLTIALTLVLTSASVGIFNLRFTNALANRDHARNLAEAAIFQAVALINANPDYGKAKETLPAITLSGLDQRNSGVLTFDPDSPLKCRHSTNNLNANAPASGDGQMVPEDGVHLVGLGVCGEARCQMEMLYYQPPFAKAIASSGNVSLDTVELAGMNPNTPFNKDTYEDFLGDTSLFSNNGSLNALRLEGLCDIRGSVGAVGRVTLGPNAMVAGEVRPGQPPEQVPILDVASIVTDIAALPSLQAPTSPVSSFAYLASSGTYGELRLNGGVLAVRGNLTVNGPISGYGSVIVDGDVQILGGSALGSDFAAVAASGDIRLEATGSTSNFFQGLLYSRGDISAKRITVIGSIVAKSEDPTKGRVDLEDMKFISTSTPIQGGIAPPKVYHLGGGDDTCAIQLSSRLKPGTINVFDYYGTGWYSIGDEDNIHDIIDNNEYPATFLGDRATVTNQIISWLDSDGQGYWDELGVELTGVLDSLAGAPGNDVISFDLNKLMTAEEQSRLLLFQEVKE